MRVIRSGRLIASFEVPRQSRHPAAGAAFTDPNLTRQMLLKSGGFEVRRGVEFGGLLRDGGRVVGVRTRKVAGGGGGGGGAEADVRADWVVGDDGSHSAVRAACGIACDITMLPVELLCFGFEWPGELPSGVGRLFINERGAESGILLMGAAPFPGGRGAGLIPARPRALEDGARAAKAFGRFLERNPQAARVFGGRRFPDDLVRVRTGFGNAERYGIPGVFLIGDAAHPVTPAGGQGANLSVNDAAALGEILLGGGVTDPLGEYERRRRAAAERSLRLSRGAARGLRLPAAVLGRLAMVGLRVIRSWPGIFSPVLRATSTAFVDRGGARRAVV
jgi:2-polyprenyl-6-methoxyphenol hydroxylase-like FAD-dependent oxidoreductase